MLNSFMKLLDKWFYATAKKKQKKADAMPPCAEKYELQERIVLMQNKYAKCRQQYEVAAEKYRVLKEKSEARKKING